MALSKSVASELLEAFRAGESVDLILASVQRGLQDLIEIEAADKIGIIMSTSVALGVQRLGFPLSRSLNAVMAVSGSTPLAPVKSCSSEHHR